MYSLLDMIGERRLVVPTSLPSASKGASQTVPGDWRSSLTRIGAHFSLRFRTCAPLAGPGVYRSRSVIFFSLSSFSLVLTDPCGRGGVREHLRERTRTDRNGPRAVENGSN